MAFLVHQLHRHQPSPSMSAAKVVLLLHKLHSVRMIVSANALAQQAASRK